MVNEKMEKIAVHNLAREIEGFTSFSEVLSYTAKLYPNKTFLHYGKSRWSYRSFDGLVSCCCRYMADEGLQQGDCVSLILRNSVDFLVIYFSAIRSRITVNPFPFHMSAADIVSKLLIVEPKRVFCHQSHYENLSSQIDNAVNLDGLGRPFTNLLRDYQGGNIEKKPIDGNEIAVLYHSSGTMGESKIIQYSHKSMVATQASMVRAEFSAPDSVHLCLLPLGHTSALRHTIKPCIATGSTIVLYDSFWKIRGKLWEEIERYRVTFFQVVPSILTAILHSKYKGYSRSKVQSLRFIGCGSAFLPPNVQSSFENRFGIPIASLYGLSETGATHFANPFDQNRKLGSMGKPFDFVDVCIFDKHGKKQPSGTVGEIGIRGTGLFSGYLNSNTLYENSIKNGYFMSGDLGYEDSEENLFYVDRKKDLIIKGGINIVPSEIEQAVYSHPFVEEAAVIGMPDTYLGETIKCYIVAKSESVIDINELKAFCEMKLGKMKSPSEFEILDSLPKGPSGKILKRALRSL